jgi:hypothetical protein
VQVDAVEQRTADLAEVALDLGPGAAALTRRISIESAPAPVQMTSSGRSVAFRGSAWKGGAATWVKGATLTTGSNVRGDFNMSVQGGLIWPK